jgi:hypothetical protein
MFSWTLADACMRSPGTVNAGQSWSYNIPARPSDVIRLEARALGKFIKRERLFVVHDNVFFNQRGEVICSGPRLDHPAQVNPSKGEGIMTTTFESPKAPS